MEKIVLKQVNESVGENKKEIEEKVLNIIEQFQEHFPDHKLIYNGVQHGYGTVKSLFLFTIDSEYSSTNSTTFSVTELDLQTVESAFIEKMKMFGEDVVETV
jgi:hypothetical protein